MLTRVLRLEKLGDFRLRVRFNDGSEGVHDFAAMISEPGPMLELLRHKSYFARVFLEFGAPTWPNGFDIASEWLRREMEAGGELSRVAAEYARSPTCIHGRQPTSLWVLAGNSSSTATGFVMMPWVTLWRISSSSTRRFGAMP
jgi:hypothetical protein